MKILLLSGYDAASHKRWREGLVRHLPGFQWTVLSLPARYFSWRVRSNSLSWAYNDTETLNQKYDLIVATSMVDLSLLRGLIPNLAFIPTILYFHENQFSYPENSGSKSGVTSLSVQVTNLYSALCADYVVFNSCYNRDTFFVGAERMLQNFPDHVPSGLVSEIKDKSQVLPVPLDKECFRPNDRSSVRKEIEVVWNHRWEYDKGPDRLLAIVEGLPKDLPLQFHIVGQQFRAAPEVFPEIKKRLEINGWLGRWGYIEDMDEYRNLLTQSDVVLSTASHDFQGLAVLEGVAAGCMPVVPDRLAYQEFFASEFRYASCIHDSGTETESAIAMLSTWCEKFTSGSHGSVPNLEALSWDRIQACYQDLISRAGI